jgi:hypothetical protein
MRNYTFFGGLNTPQVTEISLLGVLVESALLWNNRMPPSLQPCPFGNPIVATMSLTMYKPW